MKKRICYVLILLLLQLSACARRGDVVYEAMQEASSELMEEQTEQEEAETGAAAETAEQVTENEKQKTAEKTVEEPGVIFVDISGAVQRAGVYELPEGSRMFQAIEAAGGFTEAAETRCVNQADALADGVKIYIYTREEAEALGGWMQLTGLAAGSPAQGGTASSSAAGSTGVGADGKVNLNRAGKTELMTLPGVGEARADAIITWRETQGAFSKIEDIMKVSGIKEKLFEQICDKITV